MITSVVGWSLKFRRMVLALAIGLMVFGAWRLPDTPVDLLPEFQQPTVEVQTEALGLSAEEVESFITSPLEHDLLNGVAFLDRIESASLPGLSSIVMTFEPGTDVLDARQVVQERLTQAHALPRVSRPPQMIQPLSSTSRAVMIRLSSEQLTPVQVSVLARWVIHPTLLGVDGVANVAIWGQRDRQLQVQVDPARLARHRVSLSQIIATTGNALSVSPLTFLEASTPGTGGFLDTINQRLNVFHEQAITTARELAEVAIDERAPAGGSQLALGDVANVVEGHQALIGDALCSEPSACLMLVVEKFPEANTPEVTGGVEAALQTLRSGGGLADMQFDASAYRPAQFIERSYGSLGIAALIGAAILLVLILAVTWHWRTAVITVLSIAVSMVASALVLSLREEPVNLLVMAGLLLAITVVVDDAVIGVEGSVRRLRDQQALSGGLPAWRAILDGVGEIRSALLFATFALAVVCLPMFFLDGAPGSFLPPLVASYLLAVGVSFAVALTLTPALSMMLLTGEPHERRGSPLMRWLQVGYARIVPRALSTPVVAWAIVGVCVLGVAIVIPTWAPSMRPGLQEPGLLVDLEAPPGTSLTKMQRVTARAVEALGAVDGVSAVGGYVGRAVMSDQVANVNTAEIWVDIGDAADHGSTLTAVEEVVGEIPEVEHRVGTYSDARVRELLRDPDDDVVIRVYGPDGETLSEKAQEIRALVATADGVTDAGIVGPPEEPTIEIHVDLERSQRFGVSPGDVRRSATTLLSGIAVGNLFEEQKVFDVVVWGTPRVRDDVADVQALLIDTPSGRQVRLDEVAAVRIAPHPVVIRHESSSRYSDVAVDVAGRDAADVANEIEGLMQGVAFPVEHHAEVFRPFADERATQARVVALTVASVLAVFLLLQAAFGSWRVAAIAFLALAVSVSGGALALAFDAGTVSLGSIAGGLGVWGIALRQTIVSVRHYGLLEADADGASRADVVQRGTLDRLPSLVTTVLGSIGVMLPFLIAGAEPGFEIVQPMAVILTAGLLTTALACLVVLPALYARYGSAVEADDEVGSLLVRLPEVDPVGG